MRWMRRLRRADVLLMACLASSIALNRASQASGHTRHAWSWTRCADWQASDFTVTRPAPAPARYLSRLTTLRSGGGELSITGPIRVGVVAGDPHQIAGKTPRDAAMPTLHQVPLSGVSLAMTVDAVAFEVARCVLSNPVVIRRPVGIGYGWGFSPAQLRVPRVRLTGQVRS